ncbi:MAG: ribose 5-phosphate isomerase B [Bacillota bacterium]|jgi:ribose 5-phosphate isomerase B|nr:MAG: ribose 5-phosphate isomerase B [Bacillota bacterium]
MRIAVGADHAGYQMKDELAAYLVDQGHDVQDFGTFSADSVDYPDVALRVARAVALGEADRGLIVCGTGIGTSIVANKVRGVRAALCHDTFSARMARQHNDSNVLCLGARVIGPALALEILTAWLGAGFEAGGRHERRVRRIAELEEEV